MYKIIQGKTYGLKDVENFMKILNTLDRDPVCEARSLFNSNREIIVSRAPGRLDVMGGIADYSGSLVLQLPIKEATFAAVQLASDRSLKIISLPPGESGRSNYFEMSLEDFADYKNSTNYKSAQQYFRKKPSTQWAAYVAGAFLVLMKEKGILFRQGANILIYSNVPEGKGVSSSAALEVAVMNSICKAFNIFLPPNDLALLCQKVENFIVGAPCGIMDQITAVFGKANQLLALLCQPADMKPFIDIPEEVSFWGIDSGIKHSVSGADYTSVRIGTFMGQRIITELLTQHDPASPHYIHSKYLANITPSIYEQYFAEQIPLQMRGSEFIQQYQETADDVTEINPEVIYNIKKPTTHPIYEHFRVSTFAELLQEPLTNQALQQLGELMYQSHASYSACGLGSKGTDRLVELARKYGSDTGVFGAKITGGGSGGTVVILGKTDASRTIETIVEKYLNETAYEPYVFSGSSMGTHAFDHIVLKEADG